MKLPATATLEHATALLSQLGSDVDTIDASELKAFDTSVVAVLLEAHRRAKERGASFTVSGAPPKLRELARLYGVEELLSLDAT